jgi:chemotaxis methyl-accepting protein methylase
VARAAPAFANEPRVRVEQADICEHAFEPVDVVTIFDVLHYFGPERQAGVVRRIRAALGPGGLLVARVGDVASGLRPVTLAAACDAATPAPALTGIAA